MFPETAIELICWTRLLRCGLCGTTANLITIGTIHSVGSYVKYLYQSDLDEPPDSSTWAATPEGTKQIFFNCSRFVDEKTRLSNGLNVVFKHGEHRAAIQESPENGTGACWCQTDPKHCCNLAQQLLPEISTSIMVVQWFVGVDLVGPI